MGRLDVAEENGVLKYGFKFVEKFKNGQSYGYVDAPLRKAEKENVL